MEKIIKIGTRGSLLALCQAELTAKLLMRAGIKSELVKIVTSGDKFAKSPLSKIGGKGLFVKEIEEALLNRDVDIAVHSLKDMPGEKLTAGLVFSAYLEREDARDLWIPRTNAAINSRDKITVGTSSLRRSIQLKLLNNNLEIESMRGNVNTRVEKLDNGGYDAIVLAHAGILRLGIKRQGMAPISKDDMVPAPGQGVIVVESRQDDPLNEDFKKINHPETEDCAKLERDLICFIGGNCFIPFGVNFEKMADKVTARLFLQLEGKPDCLKLTVSDSWNNRQNVMEDLKRKIDAYIHNV